MRSKNENTLNAILEFINGYYFENNDYPTLSLIAEELEIGTTTAHRYVTELINRGEIEKNNRFRSLQTKEISKSVKRADKFPIVGEIACGTPILAEENIESYNELKNKKSEERKEHLKSLNVVSNDENAIWLIDYWCGKDIRGLIQMPFLRHWIMHIEASLRIKNKIHS